MLLFIKKMKVNKCTYNIYFLGLYDCLMSTVLSLHASNGSKMDQHFLLVIFFSSVLIFWFNTDFHNEIENT